MEACWFLKPKVWIIGGRFGDLIQCLSVFREFGNVVVITSEEYASVFEGASYVESLPVQCHWCDGIPKMQAIAKERFGGGTVIQWWSTGDIPFACRGGLILKWNGKSLGIDPKRWPTYGHSMMDRIGFPDERVWRALPLVFDKRDYERESDLLHRVNPRKPMLLYNFTGISSPFGYLDVLHPILQGLRKDFHIVDLGKIKAHRIYDLLGLYDAAVGLLTCDTATLHLAPASKVPYIAWTQNSWLGSVPKGNCVLQIPYDKTIQHLSQVKAVLEKWARASIQSPAMLVSGQLRQSA